MASVPNRIPGEVHRFFDSPGGHSIIVRGDAGTGKTTFALQVVEELQSMDRSFYHSTRVSDRSLLSQFGWLNEMMNAAELSDNFSRRKGASPAGRHELSDLKGIAEGMSGLSKGSKLAITVGRDMGELEGLYRKIESNLPHKCLAVIDSIDAMADMYGLTSAKLLNTIQRDIVEVYGSRVLFVAERSTSDLDYLVDGVINLSRSEFNRRRLREMEILKMRGCEIQQPKYIFTLSGGRIQTFGYPRAEPVEGAAMRWRAIPDREGAVSTGIADLDVPLDGLARGSMTLIELGPGVPGAVSGAIEASLVSNFAAQGRGVIWVPMRKASAESARARVVPSIPKERFDSCVRIPEKANQMNFSDAPYILPFEGESAFLDFKWQNIEYSLSGAGRPILVLMGFDTMQSMYGSELSDQLMDFLAMVRRNQGIFVALAPPSVGSIGRMADLASTRLRVDRVGGTVLMYGEEPFTECYTWHFEPREVGGGVSLTPIL
mgnify:CR=1 FL=1